MNGLFGQEGKFRHQLVQGILTLGMRGDDDEVHTACAGFDLPSQKTKGLANHPLDLVAADGLPVFFAHRQTQAGVGEPVGHGEDLEVFPAGPPGKAVDPLELKTFSQVMLSQESESSWSIHLGLYSTRVLHQQESLNMENHYDAPILKGPLPGPKAKEILDRDAKYVSPSYTRDYPLVAERGRGVWVEDIDGNVFLDMAAGIAVTATGHCHPKVVAAIEDQAAKLIHLSGTDFYYQPQADLAKRLSDLSPGGDKKVFFGNSGAEAVESAFKLARWHTKRQCVIAFQGAFHGRTMGALSLCASKPVQKEHFFPMVPGVFHVPYGDMDAIHALLSHQLPASELAAVFVEAIQGEGGYRIPDPGFLPAIRELCDRTGAMMVCDEVQAGMGRTGKLFAYEHDGIVPDLVTSAKGIASGMPLGAMIARAELMDWVPGSHASTFGGNPVACRAALATLDLLEGGLIENARKVGAYLKTRLEEVCRDKPGIVEVRGRGLMIAVETESGKMRNEIVHRAFEKGMLILGCGPSSVRFSPALVLTEKEADLAASLFAESL